MNPVAIGLAVGMGGIGGCWCIAWCIVRLVENQRPDLADYPADERAQGDWPYLPEVFHSVDDERRDHR